MTIVLNYMIRNNFVGNQYVYKEKSFIKAKC